VLSASGGSASNAVIYAHLATTANLVGTYVNNGGIGDTFTLTATGVPPAASFDSTAPVLNNLYLLRAQTTQFQGGVWQYTTAGTTGISAVFTRATNYNTAALLQSNVNIRLTAGVLYANSTWQLAAASGSSPTLGTTALTYSLIAQLINGVNITTTQVATGGGAQGAIGGASVISGLTLTNPILNSSSFGGFQLETGWATQTLTTGFTLTLSATTHLNPITPAGTLASGTITMPAGIANGFRALVSTTQAITALTVSPNSGQSILGAPTSLAAGGSFEMTYDSAITTWLPYASGLTPGSLIGIQIFSTVGTNTYTPTPGMGSIEYEFQGSGGGSGGVLGGTGWTATSGGGAGGYIRGRLTSAQVGVTGTVTIGAGGTAGSSSGPGNGGNGTISSLVVTAGTISVNGGNGSSGNANVGASTTANLGALGGALSATVAGTVLLNLQGNSSTVSLSGGQLLQGYSNSGANSNFGAGGLGLVAQGAANAATGFGGGGGGAFCLATSQTGAVGSGGYLIIYEYR
jgi:hypothetical protein